MTKKVTIEFCTEWGYDEEAAGLADELNASFSNLEIELIPSRGGRFEVTVDDKLIYSKLETDRFPNPGEVPALMAK